MDNYHDLTKAENLISTTQIAQILYERKKQNLIYTYIGNILLVINPFQDIGIYGEDYSNQYLHKYSNQVATPHVYGISNNAFLSMKYKEQSIIISGESGAGKTENSKFILEFLTRASLGKSKELQKKLLDSNPILEAFGNAKTLKNNNSSRFGKYSTVYFSKNEDIVGGKITYYLLEKTRVVFQPASERNFHAFYYLTKGAPEDLKKKLYLVPPEDNLFLNKYETEISTIDDFDGYKKVCNAFEVLGITQKQILLVWGLLATLLNLGNITFIEGKRQNTSEISELAWINIVASQIGNDPKELERVLLKKRLQSGNRKSVYDVNLTVQQAYVSRDALAKRIYEKLFTWVVCLINEKLAPKVKYDNAISILDIFGFENFEVNSMEQLCINYANEKLQDQFNTQLFETEQNEYLSEGIKFQNIKGTDNSGCIKLFEDKVLGIWNLLNEECVVPKGNDFTFLQKISNTVKNNRYIGFGKNCFTVRHYACDVTYMVEGLLEKNKDSISIDLEDWMSNCKNPFIAELFPVMNLDNFKSTKKTYVGSSFRDQLFSLKRILDQHQLHYVRCIKPNNSKTPDEYDFNFVDSQLKSQGMLEIIQLRKSAFSYRATFEEFLSKFGELINNQNQSSSEKVFSILSNVSLGQNSWTVGNTKVFCSTEQLSKVEIWLQQKKREEEKRTKNEEEKRKKQQEIQRQQELEIQRQQELDIQKQQEEQQFKQEQFQNQQNYQDLPPLEDNQLNEEQFNQSFLSEVQETIIKKPPGPPSRGLNQENIIKRPPGPPSRGSQLPHFTTPNQNLNQSSSSPTNIPNQLIVKRPPGPPSRGSQLPHFTTPNQNLNQLLPSPTNIPNQLIVKRPPGPPSRGSQFSHFTTPNQNLNQLLSSPTNIPNQLIVKRPPGPPSRGSQIPQFTTPNQNLNQLLPSPVQETIIKKPPGPPSRGLNQPIMVQKLPPGPPSRNLNQTTYSTQNRLNTGTTPPEFF